MTRGRKAIPQEIKERSGAFVKHPERRNKNAPKADGLRPEMPPDFDDHESQKWDQMCEILSAKGILSSDLVEILTAYCTAYGGWMRAREAVKKLGIVLVSKKGGEADVKRNPFSVELHKYRDDMNRLLPEFGLTPASRQKVAMIAPTEVADDPFAAIMARMGRG
jgi:P27 family predicted phage terminase small subunit